MIHRHIVNDSTNNQLSLLVSYLLAPTSVSLLAYGNDIYAEIMLEDDVTVALRGSSSCGQNSGGRPLCGGICGKNSR